MDEEHFAGALLDRLSFPSEIRCTRSARKRRHGAASDLAITSFSRLLQRFPLCLGRFLDRFLLLFRILVAGLLLLPGGFASGARLLWVGAAILRLNRQAGSNGEKKKQQTSGGSSHAFSR